MGFSNKFKPEVLLSDSSEIADTIHDALASAGLMDPSEPRAHERTVSARQFRTNLDPGAVVKSSQGAVVEKLLGKIAMRPTKASGAAYGAAGFGEQVYPGQFTRKSYTGDAGVLEYKLYVPSSYAARALERVPLIVMLHGCTQSPDDFATGTRMNELAEKHCFLVAYPSQSAAANGSKCWNWFRSEDQGRNVGEPSLIAGMTREIAGEYRIDDRRIFVAGLSAGAAMALILGAAYPELYAGVGAHSGLAPGAAHDAASAFTAMRSGSPSSGATRARRNQQPQGRVACAVPAIVFHGDCDNTVDVKNSVEILEWATRRGKGMSRLSESVEAGAANGGRFTRTVYADVGRPVVEYWLLHGAGHAWSGGNPKGSFTDAQGPDASSEMIRFFYSQVHD